MRLVLTNATIIDCIDPIPKPNSSIIIEDGKITNILLSQTIQFDENTDSIINLNGQFVLPGLWDVHIHPDYPLPPSVSIAEQALLFGQRLIEGLTESGVTGVRTGGAAHFLDVLWRDAFEKNQYIGPRVFASGNFLTSTGGHFLDSGQAIECDGPFGFVENIRTQIKNGVDHIKLNLSGGIMGPNWDQHKHSFLLDEELEAAFAICKKRNMKIMAHATNPLSVKKASTMGAHSIEHGYIMDEECIELMIEHSTWYVPTLAITQLTDSQSTDSWEKEWSQKRNLNQHLSTRAENASKEHSKWFLKSLKSGVKMALGSDIKPLKDSCLLEMGLWVKCGATEWETLLAATAKAAELCGVGNQLGTISKGKIADLIVVGDNPLEDIRNLRNLKLVIKNGEVVSDKRKLKN